MTITCSWKLLLKIAALEGLMISINNLLLHVSEDEGLI